MQEYLSTQSLQHVKGINQTTRDQLRATLKTGIANEESIDQLRIRIQAVFTNASDVRANTIARSETTRAFEYASHEVLQQMSEQDVINARQWLTVQDDRVRPTHAEIHGYVVRFNNCYPGGIEPGSEITCRCTEIGVMVDARELS